MDVGAMFEGAQPLEGLQPAEPALDDPTVLAQPEGVTNAATRNPGAGSTRYSPSLAAALSFQIEPSST